MHDRAGPSQEPNDAGAPGLGSAAADPIVLEEPAEAGEAAVRYCQGCGYELLGLELPSCPECGRAFDPADPSTTSSSPIPLVRRRRIRRVTLWFAIVLTIGASMIHTIIPIPMRGSNLRLWVWLGRTYGVEEMWLSSWHVRARHWAGRIYEVEANDRSTGRVAWSLSAPSDERWNLRVDKQGVGWQDIIMAYNMMKDEMFCVRFTGSVRPLSVSGFEATGSKVDILSAIVSHYGVKLLSMVVDDQQSYVWYFDEESRRMKTRGITVEEARTLPLWQSGPTKRLVPRVSSIEEPGGG